MMRGLLSRCQISADQVFIDLAKLSINRVEALADDRGDLLPLELARCQITVVASNQGISTLLTRTQGDRIDQSLVPHGFCERGHFLSLETAQATRWNGNASQVYHLDFGARP